jgi:hypothetical protein
MAIILFLAALLVIASQRVRPKVAGPMTGSAKQSRAACTEPAAPGLLRRPFGPPRNDACVSLLATLLRARALPRHCKNALAKTSLQKRGGRRSAKRRIHPLAASGGAALPPVPRRRGARPAGRARLSALRRGSRQRLSPGWLNSRPCFLGRGSGGRYPPSPVPVQGLHLPHRP